MNDCLNSMEDFLLDFLIYRKTMGQDASKDITDSFLSVQEEEFDGILENDMEFMRGLFSEINMRLYPFVVEVLNENEYEGSPLFEDVLSREYLAQLVDQIIERAAASLNDIEEIQIGTQSSNFWNKQRMLRGTVESITFNEIFVNRRPRYRWVRRRRPPLNCPVPPIRPMPMPRPPVRPMPMPRPPVRPPVGPMPKPPMRPPFKPPVRPPVRPIPLGEPSSSLMSPNSEVSFS